MAVTIFKPLTLFTAPIEWRAKTTEPTTIFIENKTFRFHYFFVLLILFASYKIYSWECSSWAYTYYIHRVYVELKSRNWKKLPDERTHSNEDECMRYQIGQNKYTCAYMFTPKKVLLGYMHGR